MFWAVDMFVERGRSVSLIETGNPDGTAETEPLVVVPRHRIDPGDGAVSGGIFLSAPAACVDVVRSGPG